MSQPKSFEGMMLSPVTAKVFDCLALYIGPVPRPYMIVLQPYRPIQLNMMAVMTSLTFKYALKMPGIAPQTAPKTVEAIRQSHHGACSSSANTRPPNAPTVY